MSVSEETSGKPASRSERTPAEKPATGNQHPPHWAQHFLEWYCRPELLEDLQGDLNEYFQRHCKTKSSRRAQLIYVLDVFKFFRSYTVRKPEFLNLLIHWFMIGSYIKTSGRSILRNKLFSTINIVGLAIGMCVGLLMIGMLHDSFSYDRFHTNHDRIYRVISQYQFRGSKDNDFSATTSLRAAKAVKETISGIENVAIMRRDFQGDITTAEKTLSLWGFWANESFFNVFSFQLLQGNPQTALKAPFSVVLTETAAQKLFGNVNSLGKNFTLHDQQYTITGIMKDIPVFSHIQFEMLGSLSTREITEKDNAREMAWDNMSHVWAYALLRPDADVKLIKEILDNLSAREDKTIKDVHVELALQPLDNIVVGPNYSNAIGQTIGSTTIWTLGCLTLVVILSACFNYTNLSVARSFRRSREVGIRKTIGALKSHVLQQFITESIIISLIALIFAFGLFLVIRPHFIGLESSLQELLVLDLTPGMVLLFIAFALVVGIFAGLFPALWCNH